MTVIVVLIAAGWLWLALWARPAPPPTLTLRRTQMGTYGLINGRWRHLPRGLRRPAQCCR